MSPESAAAAGMLSALHAARKGARTALIDSDGARSFGDLHARANQFARALRGAGLRAGDGIALLCSNRIEFVEVFLAAMRIGLRITPVNWHLAREEARYIVENCEAKALVVEARFAALFEDGSAPPIRVAIGRADGFAAYGDLLAAESTDDPPDPMLGAIMLYTSGTTGRPKGVFRRNPEIILPQTAGSFADYRPDEDVNLCAGPAYHAAPLLFDLRWPLASGVPIVMMQAWDSAAILDAMGAHRVTHAHMAPIMFHRLLAAPEDVRARFDPSALRRVFHGAAPCPIAVKRAMIDWWGPVLWEYYAASEGGSGIHITSQDWLAKPGSVGRRPSKAALKVLRADGAEAAADEEGLIYMQASSDNPFEYFGAPEKTQTAHRDGYFTLGDVGRLDADDFLFLTGRTAECIISGGVNIYPQEIDDALGMHPAVEDCCAFGAPNEEWGEEVRACVQLRQGFAASEDLRAELLDFVRVRLSRFKCPRAIDFVDALPRLPTGKIQRAAVRAPYWAGKERAI